MSSTSRLTILITTLLSLNGINSIPADNTMEVVGNSGVSAQQVSFLFLFLFLKFVQGVFRSSLSWK